MIELNEKVYVLAFWFIPFKGGDWMCCVSRPIEPKDSHFKIQYRFRYYETADVWDGKDKKNWYKATTPEGEEKVLKLMREMVTGIEDKMGGIMQEVLIQGDGEKATKELMKQGWAHLKSVD